MGLVEAVAVPRCKIKRQLNQTTVTGYRLRGQTRTVASAVFSCLWNSGVCARALACSGAEALSRCAASRLLLLLK